MAAKDPRQFARIDVGFAVSKKLAGADPRAKWLDVVGILWSVQNLTDGEVTPAIICATAGVPTRYGSDLMNRDRWHRKGHHCPDCPQPEVAGNVTIHHFDHHQDDAETVRRNREEKAKSGRLGNHSKWNHAGPFENCRRCNP